MFLNSQHPGSAFYEDSPSKDMHDPYALGARTYPPTDPIELEAESPFSRQDHLSPSSSGFAADAEMSANRGIPLRPGGTPGVPYAGASTSPQDWHPHYNACLQYFIDQGQHSPSVQSIAAFVNIRLPCQKPSNSVSPSSSSPSANAPQTSQSPASSVSLRPYIRRLIVTGHDAPSVLNAFFGDNWPAGVGCIFKQERVNYLFTAKSSGWASTKAAYDIHPDEQTPFLRALRDPTEDELREAEGRWSEWLAMEDWMLGPRSPWLG